MRMLLLLFLVLPLLSCNNNGEESTNEKAVSEEDSLIADVQAHPDSLLPRESLIEFYREEGNYDKALQETNKVLSRDSMNDRFFYIRGTLQFENADTAKAIQSFEKAVA